MEAFQKCGKIVLTRVMVDKTTGKSRGFGFVSFSEVEEADLAFETMQGELINNRAIRIDRSTPKNSTKKHVNRVNPSNGPSAESFGRYGDRGRDRVTDSRYNVSRNPNDGRYDTRNNDNTYNNQTRQQYGGSSYGNNDSYSRSASNIQPQSQSQQQYDPSVCFAFQRGHCKYGDRCRYSHDMSLLRSNNDTAPDQGYANSRQSQQYMSNNNSSLDYSNYNSGSSYQPQTNSQYGSGGSYQPSSRGDAGGGQGQGGYNSSDYYASKAMSTAPSYQPARGSQPQQSQTSGYEYDPTSEYDYASSAASSYRPSADHPPGSAPASTAGRAGASDTLSHLYTASSGSSGYRNPPLQQHAPTVGGSSRYG